MFLKIRLVLRYSLEQILSTISVMTFSRYTAFLPTFREEPEFDLLSIRLNIPINPTLDWFRVAQMIGFHLRTLNSSIRRHWHLHEHRYFSKPPFFKIWNNLRMRFTFTPEELVSICKKFPSQGRWDRIFQRILFLFCPNHYRKLAHSGSLCSYQTTA